MIRSRTGVCLAFLLGSVLMLATAGPARAWGWRHWGYWGGPYYGWGWGGGWGWGYPFRYASFYPYAGYWSYPYAYSYYPYFYDPYPLVSWSTPPNTYGSTVAAPQQSFYYTPDDRAHLTISVPSPTAQVLIEGVPMKQDGSVRTFESPPLQRGQDYHYTVEARWRGLDGRMHDDKQTFRITRGQAVNVNFSQ